MYDLPHFKAANDAEVIAYIQAHPFITLCGCGADSFPVATHVPVLIEERNGTLYLQAHTMREQQHTKAFEHNPHVLAIFSGAHTYISASWYKHKQIGSTWNYQAVHAKGKLTFTDETALYSLLQKLTERFEGNNSPSLIQHMKPAYIQSLMQHIIAFEIEVTKIEHVFKLSQNRDKESYKNIIRHLNEQNNTDAHIIADEMSKRKL